MPPAQPFDVDSPALPLPCEPHAHKKTPSGARYTTGKPAAAMQLCGWPFLREGRHPRLSRTWQAPGKHLVSTWKAMPHFPLGPAFLDTAFM